MERQSDNSAVFRALNLQDEWTFARDRARRRNMGTAVYRNEESCDDFAAYGACDLATPNHHFLTEKKTVIRESDIDPILGLCWMEIGFDQDRPTGSDASWTFSILDLIWLQVASSMMDFEIPLATIATARKCLNSMGGVRVSEDVFLSLFELYVARAAGKRPCFLLVFPDGEVDLATDDELRLTDLMYPLTHHVRIGLNALVQSVFPKYDVTPDRTFVTALSTAESTLLCQLRNGNYTSLTVKMSDGRIQRIRATEVLADAKFSDLLKDSNYQDILFKQRDGKIVGVDRTILTKL